jgi:putative phosphoesterase
MRIGVVSDTHDRQEAVAEAVRLLAEQHVELILHCGDIESPETVRVFRPVPTHFVFGNWDKEKAKLAAAIKEIGGKYSDSFGAIELKGKRIAWVHSHERHQLRQLENADFFDYVFYGHTHVREQHRTGKTLVANPGALFRANPKTCIVLDLATGEIKPIIVPVQSRAANGTSHPAALDDGTGSVMMPAIPPAPAPARVHAHAPAKPTAQTGSDHAPPAPPG